MIYGTGRYLNLLERALSVTPTPAADAALTVEGLRDSSASDPFRFGSAAANPKIEVDLAAFATASGSGSADIVVRAGERRRIVCTAGTVQIQNLVTGRYLATGGASWQAGAANVVSASAANYQVEAKSVCLADVAVLRVTWAGSAAGVVDFPRWNALVIVGHTFEPALTVTAQTDDNSGFSSPTTAATFSLGVPNAWIYSAAGFAERYLRLNSTGTPRSAPLIGELVPCWLETSARFANLNWEVSHDFRSLDHETRAGKLYSTSLSGRFPARTLRLPMSRNSAAQYQEARDELFGRAQGRRYPVLINPNESEADGLIYGRLASTWKLKRALSSRWEDELAIVEDAFPTILA